MGIILLSNKPITFKAQYAKFLTSAIVADKKIGPTDGVLSIPDGYQVIGRNAFDKYKTTIDEIIIPLGVEIIDLNGFSMLSNLSKVTIKEGLVFIKNSAFQNCTNLQSIEIPSSVDFIQGSAFGGCYGLKTITIAEGNQKYSSENGIVYNKDKTELVCHPTAKDSYTIPGSVTKIGENALSFSSITKLTIPDTVKSIDFGAFSSCHSLTDVTIGKNIEKIGSFAFDNCINLKTINIPQGINRIESNTFNSCEKLNNISIPTSVTYLDENAFGFCYNLTINYAGTESQWNAISKSKLWNQFANKITIKFSDNTTITIPEGPKEQ